MGDASVGRRTGATGLALVALAASISVVSCAERGGDAVRSSRPPTALSALEGRDISLTGEITRTFGARVVEVGRARRDPLIVVLASPQPMLVGQRVQASGEVRTFRRSELESELGVDLGPEVVGLEGEKCLLARSVRLA